MLEQVARPLRVMKNEKDKKREPPPLESEFWIQSQPRPPVQTEWARGVVPGKLLTPPKRLASDDPLSVAADEAAPVRSPRLGDLPPPRAPAPGESAPESHETIVRADEPLLTGQTIGGRYRLERVLGSGGMGVVYLAHDGQVEGETFAIKVLKSGLRADALALLREEVHKTRKLSHPNIVDVHSLNSDGGRFYVLMEHLEGKPLNVLLDEEFGRGMPLSRAWPVIEDVGAALGCAHDHSVIHSDLKPANMFITTSGRTKLLDFGIARASRGQAAQSGVFALTPAYASCEMLEGREPDARDDIYSFACVIYEMLSGRRPFGDLDAIGALESHATPAPLASLSKSQNAALAKALAFERNARTRSVEELLAGLSSGASFARRPLILAGAAAVTVLIVGGLGYLAFEKLSASRAPAGVTLNPVSTAAVAPFAPSPHSIAVLPFVNLSGDKDQDYFSDGLTEELLNSLASIDQLQVAARTSSFAFKGRDVDIGTIARKLNVGSVLEGSVRRSAHTVRVTAQLINAVTGYNMWSQTFDRNLGDVLKLETEIASSVAAAMKVTLLGDVAAKIELGSTQNPPALDQYLRATRILNAYHDAKDIRAAIAAFSEAIRLDPNYALAYAGRSRAENTYANAIATGAEVRESFEKTRVDAQHALTIAPNLAEGHLALAQYYAYGALDFSKASVEYERAASLAQGSAVVLRSYAEFSNAMGRIEPSIAAARRALVLDPLNRSTHFVLGKVLYGARRYKEALQAYQDGLALDPEDPTDNAERGLTYYALGNYPLARDSCQVKPDYWESQFCLAIVMNKLGEKADAQAVMEKLRAAQGDDSAYQYAEIYAQWGDTIEALRWLDTAKRVADPGLINVKIDPLLDPLRSNEGFQSLQRSLKFPRDVQPE